MKKYLVMFILLICSSCLTRAMWKNSYQDTIYNFITTKTGEEIAFLGTKYHYIFDDKDGALKRLLFWRNHHILYIDLNSSYLRLDQNNEINGYVIIKTSYTDISYQDLLYLESFGFIRQSDGSLASTFYLTGKRFAPNDTNYKPFQLSRKYNVTIYYPNDSSLFEDAAKIAISPITITLDAIIWLGKWTMPLPINVKEEEILAR